VRAAAEGSTGRGAPVLVTGMPRSGTTWLARLLATAQGTALAGREPMNPRGRQYALAGTLPGWARLMDPTARQRGALRRSYAGLNPLVYSRYGRRQWAAPLPWTRLVVKDPFAMLSVPAVVRVTGAVPVVLYRHPAAALASYRRMGWAPDLDELAPIVTAHQREGHAPGLTARDLPRPGECSEPEAMGRFWAALYTMTLSDLQHVPCAVVVDHAELARGGEPAARRLFEAVGLRWTERSASELVGERDGGAPRASAPGAAGRLHEQLGRDPAQVAQSWRAAVTDEEVAVIDDVTAAVHEQLEALRLKVCEP
jgi:hypothetical protein